MRNCLGAQFLGPSDGRVDDQIAVGHQQRVLALVGLAGLYERLDEAFPDSRTTVDGDMAGHAQLRCALLDIGALFGINAAGVGKHGMHGPAALLEIRHAEAGVEATGEGENDIFAHD